MADVKYRTYPDVEPGFAPGNVINLQINPAAFTAVGRGLEQFGEGVEQAGKQWGEVQLDAQVDKALKAGDKTVDDHLALEGEQALSDQQNVRKSVEQVIETYGKELPPYLRAKYNERIRTQAYRYWDGKLTTHDLQQGKQVQNNVNGEGYKTAMDRASNAWDNEEEYQTAEEMGVAARARDVQARGMGGNPEFVAEKLADAKADALQHRAEAMFAHDKQRAMDFIDKHEKELGTRYQHLSREFKAAAQRARSEQRSEILSKIDTTRDPVAAEGIADANKAALGDLYEPTIASIRARGAGGARGGATPAQHAPGQPIDSYLNEAPPPPAAPAAPASRPGTPASALPYSSETATGTAISDEAQQAITTALHGNERLGGLIAEAGAEYGVDPLLLARQTYQESGGRRGVVSSRGAAGVSQFIPETARLYGVDVTDDRSSTRGQAHFMADLKKEFGNYGLALAAYNWGPHKVRRWLAGARISPPAETRNYVQNITGRPLSSWLGGER